MKHILIIILALFGHMAYANCSLSGVSLDLGDYQPLSGAETDSEAQIMVNCDAGASYTLQISYGMYGTSDSNRLLKNSGSNYMLKYLLYQDLGKTTLWGQEPNHTYQGTGTGSAVAVPIFSVIPAGQRDAVPGTYSDALNITINF